MATSFKYTLMVFSSRDDVAIATSNLELKCYQSNRQSPMIMMAHLNCCTSFIHLMYLIRHCSWVTSVTSGSYFATNSVSLSVSLLGEGSDMDIHCCFSFLNSSKAFLALCNALNHAASEDCSEIWFSPVSCNRHRMESCKIMGLHVQNS